MILNGEHKKHEDETDIRIIQYVDGTKADGELFWAYVAMKPERYEEYYSQVMANEVLDLDDFGEILHQGGGAEPPEEIKQAMIKQYGMDAETEAFMTELGKAYLEEKEEIEKQQS